MPLSKTTEKSLYCFNCYGANHLAKHCPFERLRQRRKPTLRCYRCQKERHVSSKMSGKRRRGRGVSATLAPGKMKTNLPVMHVCINVMIDDALIDSGCTRSLVRSSVCSPSSGPTTEVLNVDGKSLIGRE